MNSKSNSPALLLSCVSLLLASANCFGQAKDKVFSGPQPGEKLTSFKVVELGSAEGSAREHDVIAENKGGPIALVFVHNVERSMAPLLRVIDQYGAERKEKLRTELVFLSADRIAAEQRYVAAGRSLRLQSRMSLSLDGVEGPGNYGLNKECLMTVVIAKDDKVTANFALVQPGIADGQKIIEALARAAGDAHPPQVADLQARDREAAGPQRNTMRGEGGAMAGGRPAVDLSKLNIETEAGLKNAVKALITEVQSLRREVENLRGKPSADTAKAQPKDPLPGAAPTDAQLEGLLRRFIQPSNDDATVDKVLAEVEAYVKGNPDLTKQAIDGWTRVLHIPYGTVYAQKAGKTFVEKLKKQ
jgi:hypothetical protein